jgi:hypothetical protein
MAPDPGTVRQRGLVVLVVLAWLALLAVGLVIDARLVRPGPSELASPGAWLFIAASAGAVATGALVAWVRPRLAVGWLFLAIGSAVMVWGPLDGYATWALHVSDGPRTGGRIAAVVSDIWFVWLLAPLALALLLTPDGRPPSRRWSFLVPLAPASAVVAFGLSLVSARPLDAPYTSMENPWASPSVARFTDPVLVAAVYVLMACVLLGAVSVVVRCRRAEGDDRRALRWLFLAGAPVPLLFVPSLTGDRLGGHQLIVVVSGIFMVTIPVAA